MTGVQTCALPISPSIICVGCEKRVPLWDEMEQCFARPEIQQRVRDMHEEFVIELNKLLVLDVGARITSANQKWIEVRHAGGQSRGGDAAAQRLAMATGPAPAAGGNGLFYPPQEEGGDAEHPVRGLRAAGAALG